ncbi:hypothetical protein [Lutibacter citreus]|uniref:hypothetical protein n=1 Tax=Lutibacter citreus TaxID=2138210 RepID=UPI000DBE9C0D|nr:hypothetical protein [Lutibacter citreus]
MKHLLLITLLLPFFSFSQVGINTTNPKATLDLRGNPSEITIADGVIAPRISRINLIAKTAYSTDQIGIIIYITDLSGTVNTQTEKITEIGYYYFDGNIWRSMNSNTKLSYGDTKQGFQSTDHNGWIKLNGRAISSLTSTQQTQATTLGFSSNLPDATNSFLVQNGTLLGTVSNSNNKMIVQANLPNVTLTGTTNTNGNHNHGYSIDSSPWNSGGSSVSNVTSRNNVPTNVAASFAGNHSHTITTSSLNGGVTQTTLDVTPKSLSVNTFVYLGN